MYTHTSCVCIIKKEMTNVSECSLVVFSFSLYLPVFPNRLTYNEGKPPVAQ